MTKKYKTRIIVTLLTSFLLTSCAPIQDRGFYREALNDFHIYHVNLLEINDSEFKSFLDLLLKHRDSCCSDVDLKVYYVITITLSENGTDKEFMLKYRNIGLGDSLALEQQYGAFYYKNQLFVVFKNKKDYYPQGMIKTGCKIPVLYSYKHLNYYSLGSFQINKSDKISYNFKCETDEYLILNKP